jgi:Dolichyl-phosphate-mannose-protein mannosyltransferase
VKPVWLCWLFVAATLTFGAIANTGIGGGSDSYGYVSQADLWLKKNLRIEQPAARNLPWPNGQWTLAPLGYRPAPDRGAIVPVYAPGLPIIFAAAKRAAGQCAIRWVVPLAGGLLVLATFGIGRTMLSDQVGLAASWLVFTSPAFLTMLAQPMSDIPVAACWAVATYGCLRRSLRGAALAGVTAVAAIMIRPNLVHLGVLMGVWLIMKDLSWRPLKFSPWRTLLYGLPAMAGCLAVAAINRNLYGAATSSGYGDLNFLFASPRGATNLVRYTSWLAESQTPFAVLGAIALFIPARMLSRERAPEGRGLLAALFAATVAAYLFWLIFDAWWYLRFLLSAWPALFISTSWLLARPSGRMFGRLGAAAVLCLGLYGLWFAHHKGIFDLGEGDRRYVAAAALVSGATAPNSIILSMQHSGTVRYYGGRMTLRYDYLEPRWLDPAVTWLVERGVHPYVLLDDWEVPEFQKRFAGASELGKLRVARVFEYQSNPKVYLYDPLQSERTGEKPVIFTSDTVRVQACPEPAAEPLLELRE